MACKRARDVTPVLDCIEVANFANESNNDSDSDGDAWIGSVDTIDSLDSAVAARARFHLSPDKPDAELSHSSQTAAVFSRHIGDPEASMPLADFASNSQSGKRRWPRSTSSSRSESPHKKQKPIDSSQNNPTQDKLPLVSPSPHTHTMKFSFMEKTSKPSPQTPAIVPMKTSNKSRLSDLTKAGVKPDPQPICSDILGSSNASQPGSNNRAKSITYLDLTGDTSDEPIEEHEAPSALRKQLAELTSERNDYRKSLHDANAKINKLERDNLLRKASEQVELENRETAAAAIERELQNAKEKIKQLAKAKRDLDEQLAMKQADAVRLSQTLDQQVEECKKASSGKSELEERVKTEKDRLLETLDKQLEERELHEKTVKNLQKELKRKAQESKGVRQRLSEQTAKCKQLMKEKSDLSAQIKTEKAQITRLQEDLDKQRQQHELDARVFESTEKQQQTLLETEVAKAKALAQNKDDLEKQAKEHESSVTRLKMEMERVRNDLEDQTSAADWYKAKFLKFKGWFYALEKESQEKDAAMRRILPKICAAAGLVLDHSQLVVNSDAVKKEVRAEESSSTARSSDALQSSS